MSLRLYNTLSKCEEELSPTPKSAEVIARLEKTLGKKISDPTKVVSMYTCGPTVYGRPHIGNYSSFLMADLLRRWLEHGHSCTVVHVKNITDVGHLLHDADQGDDKIQKQAEKEKVHPLDIARKYTEQYLDDEKTLNILEPAARPKASDYIEEMKRMIDVLLAQGNAYITNDGIYFAVSTFPQYGALSGNTISDLNAGARINVDEKKKHPADFALWKFCVGDNAHHVLRWPSPGGASVEGFPGWHIECSAMSSSLLGEQIDLHTGGEDNIFPHHECEIAQSEAATKKKPFVGLWLHKRRIDLGSEKMSKSLGNVLSVPDILALGFSAQDLRYYLLSVHYRTNLKFSQKGLEDAKIARRRIAEWVSAVEETKETNPSTSLRTGETEEAEKFISSFSSAMNSDLNTPAALGAIFEYIASARSPQALSSSHGAATLIRSVLGCVEPEREVVAVDAENLAQERDKARAAKDFKRSDQLRDQLQEMGYEVRDTPEGTKLKKK